MLVADLTGDGGANVKCRSRVIEQVLRERMMSRIDYDHSVSDVILQQLIVKKLPVQPIAVGSQSY